MTLNCFAYNCIYNNFGICYAGKIKIDENTCATFLMKNDKNDLSSQIKSNFTTSSKIECSAKNCNFNSSFKCSASSVQINFNNASCDTFVCFN